MVPARIKNWIFARQRAEQELDWKRVEDFAGMDLRRPVVMVNGCFDLLHAGHMKIIFAARRKAGRGTVIVAMDSDERVKRAKGAGRPVLRWVERAAALGYMPVDYLVEIESEGDFRRLVEVVRPDWRVQGAEYLGHPSRVEVPKVFVRAQGMRTTEIIRRCKAA